MAGILYVVATPIGNLEDITFRAINVLKSVDIIAAEDTRNTLKLLNFYDIHKHLISYHRHNENLKLDVLIKKLLDGENIAIVSDAGTPGICDPGEILVKEAIKNNIQVIPIPGACAAINAIIASGLDTNEFVFLGFLPINKKSRKEKLEEIKKQTKTIIMYEAPHRLKNTLMDLKNVLESRKVVLAREITKIHEEFIRGTVSDLIENCDGLKGEMIILVEGAKNEEEVVELNDLTINEHYEFYRKQGLQKKDIIKKVAKDRGVSKNDIYMLFLTDNENT